MYYNVILIVNIALYDPICNAQVTIIGDGRGPTLTMAGDKLWSTDALVKVGEEVPMPAPIKDTRKALSEKVFR